MMEVIFCSNCMKKLILLITLTLHPLFAMEAPKLDIFQAAQHGDLTRVQELLTTGIPVNSIDSRGKTALQFAAAYNNAKIVHELLAVGADPNIQDHQGTTALICAACWGHHEVCRELLKYNAKVNLSDNDDNTAFIYASAFRNRQVMIELIKAGSQIDAHASHNRATALTHAASNGHFEIAYTLLENGADPNEAVMGNVTPLMCAAKKNSSLMCKILINYGADIFALDNHGDSALSWASITGSLEAMQNIIQNAFFTHENEDVPAPRTYSQQLKAIAQSAFSWIPGLGTPLPTKPADRIKTILLSLKRMGISRDIKNLILCQLQEDITALLLPRIESSQKIPVFALELIVDTIYNITRKRLAPLLELAQKRIKHLKQLKKEGAPDLQALTFCPEHLLDMDEFDSNYSEQLRNSIKARICHNYLHAKTHLPLEHIRNTNYKGPLSLATIN